jgi:hypothetical protein
MTWMMGAGLAVVTGLIVAAAVVWISGIAFAGKVDALRNRLIASQQVSAPAATNLPEIVRAYATRSGGRVGAPSVFHARHEATLSTTEGKAPIDLTAEQWTGTVVPGIVWVAEGAMSGLPVRVFDAYVDGGGELSARLLGVFPVAGGLGPDYDKAELMRYLSELPVYPDAILNAQGLIWRQIDARTVAVGARSRTGAAEVRFIFDDVGDIARMESDDRPMAGSDGMTVPTPWHGTYGDYRTFGRYRIPAYGEVGWVLPDRFFTYWRGTVVSYEPMN